MLDHIAGSRGTALAAVVSALGLALVAPVAAGGVPEPRSPAAITGSFADSCRDFAAHSSKDISHVEIHYVDGRVVKDESTVTSGYAVDGGEGDEIDFALVKSGTTREMFTCPRTNRPPTALLEIRTPDSPNCHVFFESGLDCDQAAARTTWKSSSDFPTDPNPVSGSTVEAGNLLWGCRDSSPAGGCSF